jgi:hypothetical protein
MRGMSDLTVNGTNGWLSSWKGLVMGGVTAGAVLVGMLSGLWKIDARLEQHGHLLETLAAAVKGLSDKSATVEMVEGRIEQACLRMQLANKGWSCPFVYVGPQPPAPKPGSWSATLKPSR